jgi:hypothetical protein
VKSTTDTRQALESRHEADALLPVLADLVAVKGKVDALSIQSRDQATGLDSKLVALVADLQSQVAALQAAFDTVRLLDRLDTMDVAMDEVLVLVRQLAATK